MDTPVSALHFSDCYSVFDYTCTCTECGKTAMEYVPEFTISFPRTGFYRFNSYKREDEMYNGVVRLEKPRTEYCITHINPFPDSTTFITLEPAFFERLYEEAQLGVLPFFKDPDQHSMSLPAQPYWELLLNLIVQNTKHGRSKGSLYTDCLVMELLQGIFAALQDWPAQLPELSFDQKKAHCDTIERAKNYLSEHWNEDISLADIARQALVSPFHFTRVFKSFTGFSPWDYLSRQRLNYAALLLKNNASLVSEVAIQSGFNSTAHFTASFSRHFNISPAAFRDAKKQDF